MKKTGIILIMLVLVGMGVWGASANLWEATDSDTFGTYFTGSLNLTYGTVNPAITTLTRGDGGKYYVNGVINPHFTLNLHDNDDLNFDYTGGISIIYYDAGGGYVLPAQSWELPARPPLSFGYPDHFVNSVSYFPAGARKADVSIVIHKDDILWYNANDQQNFFNYHCIIEIDAAPPVIDNFSFSPVDNALWYSFGGADFCKTNSISVTESMGDSQSGINPDSKRSVIYNYGTVINPDELNTTYDGSGRTVTDQDILYRFAYSCSDMVGNATGTIYATRPQSGNSYFVIDRTPPDLPSSITSRFTVEDQGGGFKKISSLQLSWSKVEDRPIYRCGVHEYYLSLKNYANAQIPIFHGDPFETNNPDKRKITMPAPTATQPPVITTSYNLTTDLAPASKYSFGVTAGDYLFNIPETGGIVQWTTEVIYTPPKDLGIFTVHYLDPKVETIEGVKTPVYPVDIVINKGSDVRNYIKFVNIYCYETGTSDYQKLEELGTEDWHEDETINANGYLVKRFRLPVDTTDITKHAHKQYIFVPAITPKHPDQSGHDFEILGGEKPAEKLVPNLTHFNITLKTPQADNPNFVKIINPQGFDPAAPGTSVAINTNQPVTLGFDEEEIVNTGSEWQDYEGDTLKLRLFTINETALTDELEYNSPDKNFFLNCQQTVHCYAEVSEEYAGEEIDNSKTRHTDSNGLNEGIYITFDFDTPDGAFDLVDGERILDTDNTVNHPDIELELHKSRFSGDVTGVYVWNINTEEVLRADQLIDLELAAREPAVFPAGQTINFADYPGDTIRINWRLSEEETTSSLRMVVMKVTDGANTFYIKGFTELDTTRPAAVTDIEYTQGEGTIFLSWTDDVNTDTTYAIKYRKAGASEFTEINGITLKQREISISGLGYNEEIEVQVFAVDKALNYSDACPATPLKLYTPAFLGNTEDVQWSQGYTKTGESCTRYVEWDLAGARAASFEVAVNPPGVYGVESTEQAGSRHFKVSGLASRTPYSFTVQAFNTNGDRTEAVLDHTLVNFTPVSAEPVKPAQYGKADNIEFRWQAGEDGDEDILTYTIKMRQSGEAEYHALAVTTDTGFTYHKNDPTLPALFQGDYFTHGTTYEWIVETADGEVSVSSSPVSFTVDTTKPEISFTDVPGYYSNRETLGVLIKPGMSGIDPAKTTYSTTDGASGDVKDLEQITEGAQAGWYTGNVPLHDSTALYNVTVTTVNLAGREETATANNLYIDLHTPDVLTALPGLYEDNTYYYSGKAEFTLNLELSDSYSGVKAIEYGFIASPADEVTAPVERQVATEAGHAGVMNTAQKVQSTAASGEDYYLAVCAVDFAGNKSPYMVAEKPIRFDYTEAEAEIEAAGLHYYSAAYYAPDPAGINITVTAEDTESGIRETRYSVAETGTEPAVWYVGWTEAAANAVLTNGAEYRIAVRVTNQAGLAVIKKSAPFTYDNTAPVNPGLEYKTANPYLAGEAVRITAQAEDPETAVAKYRLAIGTAAGNTTVSERIPGNIDGWLEQSDPLFSFLMPAVTGVYTITLEAVNAAGLVRRDGTNYTVTIKDHDEQVIVQDSGTYQTETNKLWAKWEYTGTQGIKGYKYRLSGPGYENVEWEPAGADEYSQETEKSWEDLNLTAGGKYTVEVKADYIIEQMGSLTGESSGVTIDPTAPVFGAEDGFLTPAACHAGNFVVSWNLTEEESVISSVELLIEKQDGNAERQVVSGGWIPLLPTATGSRLITADRNGELLHLTDGERLYLTLRATNGADLSVEKGAPVVLYDNSAPPVPLVTDQGDVINLEQVTEMGLEGSWVWSASDTESGECSYSWAGVKFPLAANPGAAGILADKELLEGLTWQSTEERTVQWTGEGLPGDKETGYFLVKAVNRAGLESIGVSNGIVVDATGPLVTQVKLLQSSETSQSDSLYVNRVNDLWFSISAIDPESGIASYRVNYGEMTEEGFNPVAESYESADPLIQLGTDEESYPDLEEGEVTYFSGSCANEAELVSEYGYTKGVMLDRQLPMLDFVNGQCVTEEFFFDWQTTTVYAPVEYYTLQLWKVLPQAGEDSKEQLAGEWNRYPAETLTLNTAAWNNTPGLPAEQRITDGTYRLYVKAVSAAGNESAETMSPRVILDTTKPQLGITVTTTDPENAYAYDRLTLSYEATDTPAPGIIKEYAYKAGTPENPDAFTGGWVYFTSTQTNPQVEIDFHDFCGGLEGVPQGTVLYIKARVKDKAGLWSDITTSQAITVDKTAAAVNTLQLANRYISSENTVYGISFNLEDTESGLMEYRSIVVRNNQAATVEALENDPAKWKKVTVNQVEKSLTVADYATPGYEPFALNDRVYVAVEVRNRAGIWSAPAFSEEIIIDFESPDILLSQGTNGVKKAGEFVFNSSPFSFNYEPKDAVSPDVQVNLKLYYEAGNPVLDGEGNSVELAGDWKATDIPNLISYPFDESAWQTYTLRAHITDRAGNITEVTEKLRVNSPPKVTFDNFFDTTSLKPLTLSATVDDPDDVEHNFTYEWILPDYPHAYPEFEELKHQAAPVIRVQHASPQSQVSQYRLQLIVTDSDGKACEPYETTILVLNTVSGRLYDNEYWNPTGGERHILRGNVTVPAGFTLTIAENTIIEVASDYETGGYGLTVEGELVMEPGSEIKIENEAPAQYWKGIEAADGSHVMLDWAKITHAERGVTVNSLADVSLNNTVLDGNKVGIHVLKNGQEINGCTILGSYFYGIKEDGGAVPVLDGCVFTGNYIDYYDAEDTAVSADELQAAGRN